MGLTKVDFLSLDVEGAELSVLKGIDIDSVEIDLILIEPKENSDAILYLTKWHYDHSVDM